MDKPPSASDNDVRHLVDLALQEDGLDLTTQFILPQPLIGKASIIAKGAGVLCGQALVAAVVQAVDPQTKLHWHKQDRDGVKPGDSVATLDGSLQALLRLERPALNFLQHLSGIATSTRQFVEAAAGSKLKILDTRKTLPGWRRLQKYAVTCGGGYNHRMGLFDQVLIKDNHMAAAGGMPALLPRLVQMRAAQPQLWIELEVQNLDQLALALQAPVDRIMLDNFSLDQMQQAVSMVRGKIPLEVSGGVTLPDIAKLASIGVDYVSVGALTHSVKALDISMEIVV